MTVKEGLIHTIFFLKVTEFSFKPFKTYSRPKTRLVNKLRMNMKALLNLRFNKRHVISVQYMLSDDEENKKYKEFESAMYQVFNKINSELTQVSLVY